MDDFFSPPVDSSDPTSDFLRREAEALGSDATSFGGGSAHPAYDKDFASSASAFPDLDGGEDDLNSFVSAPQPVRAGGFTGGEDVSVTKESEFDSFENQYPEVDLPSTSTQNNGFGAQSATPSYSQPASLFQGAPQSIDEETEFIKSWKVKQAADIEKREKDSAAKKEDTIAKAQHAIDNFYREYNSKKEKNIAANKEEEAAFNSKRNDALAQGTTWERICSTVELEDSRSKTTTKSKKDLSRFKEILLALKREGDTAPGAGGY